MAGLSRISERWHGADALRPLLVSVDSLEPWPGNPRRGDIAAVAASLARFGQVKPVVLHGARIVAGHHVVAAARELGWSHVAVLDHEFASEQEALAFLLADNRTAELGSVDEQLLATQLREFDESSLLGTGYNAAFVVALERELAIAADLDVLAAADADDVPDLPVEPVSKAGEVYELGSHRLMCGDATRDLATLMAGETAAVVVTSPPYNQGLDTFTPSGMHRERPRRGNPSYEVWVRRIASAYPDSRPEPEYQAEQVALLDSLLDVTTADASVFYQHKHRYRDKQVLSPLAWISRTGWRVRQEIVWDRGSSIVLNARMFMPQDERLYWLTRGGSFVFNANAEIKSWGTVWRIAHAADASVSLPAFPIEIPHRCIAACSSRGDSVLDPYGGSGTTLIACEQLGRRCFTMEIDPRYCDLVRSRYEQLRANRGA